MKKVFGDSKRRGKILLSNIDVEANTAESEIKTAKLIGTSWVCRTSYDNDVILYSKGTTSISNVVWMPLTNNMADLFNGPPVTFTVAESQQTIIVKDDTNVVPFRKKPKYSDGL